MSHYSVYLHHVLPAYFSVSSLHFLSCLPPLHLWSLRVQSISFLLHLLTAPLVLCPTYFFQIIPADYSVLLPLVAHFGSILSALCITCLLISIFVPFIVSIIPLHSDYSQSCWSFPIFQVINSIDLYIAVCGLFLFPLTYLVSTFHNHRS